MTSFFGLIVTDDQVEDAVLATLKKWLPYHLSEVEEQVGLERGYYTRPVASSYTSRTDFDKWPEEMLPMIVTVSTGIDDDPLKDGDGRIRARFSIGVVAIVSSIDKLETRRYAYRMGAAIRSVLVRRASLDLALGARVRGVDLIGGRNNELPTEDERTMWASRQLFSVEIGDFLRTSGPDLTDPPPDSTEPWPDPPTVATANVLLDHQ